MKTREERALKIAELEGFEESRNLAYRLQYRTHWMKKYDPLIGFETTHDLINYFASFNGIMPIVEKVNKSETAPMYFSFAKRFVTLRKKFFDKSKVRFHCKNTPLLDAIQEAIIFYHENKEGGE